MLFHSIIFYNGNKRMRMEKTKITILTLIIIISVGLYLSLGNEGESTGALVGEEIDIHYNLGCRCCDIHGDILEDRGAEVSRELKSNPELGKLKNERGIPYNMRSCHTIEIQGYFVEGHIPEEAIEKLITEEPDIDGIALPGMPQGTPGMEAAGPKIEDWVVYAIDGEEISEFMVV